LYLTREGAGDAGPGPSSHTGLTLKACHGNLARSYRMVKVLITEKESRFSSNPTKDGSEGLHVPMIHREKYFQLVNTLEATTTTVGTL
jgi:hypothetical protein